MSSTIKASTSSTSSGSGSGSGETQRAHFSHFDVTEQVFLRTPHALGIVNIKPIVPGHILLIPPSPNITRLSHLPAPSIGPFFTTLQLVVSRLEEAMGATACTVAVQDGRDSGQTVEHLHVHVLPRRKGDFTPSDAVYAELEKWGFDATTGKRPTSAAAGVEKQGGPDDEDRPPRTREELLAETEWLRKLFRDVN